VTRIQNLLDGPKLKKAISALDKFTRDNPDHESLPALWLQAARAQKTPVQAIPIFRRVTDDYPDSPQAPIAQIELAQLFFVGGNQTAAAAEAKRFCEKYPNHPAGFDAWLLRAAVDAQTGKIRSAANRYAETAVRYSGRRDVGKAYVGLGDSKFRLDDFAGAQVAYWRALQVKDPTIDYGKVYFQLGLIAQKRNRPAQAHRFFLLLIQQYPNSRFSVQAKKVLRAMEAGRGASSMGVQGTLAPLSIPKTTFTVRVKSTGDPTVAQAVADKFTDAGHKAFVRFVNDRFEVFVGTFTGEMDAFFFAEQVEKKFGVKTEIVPLEQED
jgi:outer membrane protein assembly factor BamD (BamD/ComL family)